MVSIIGRLKSLFFHSVRDPKWGKLSLSHFTFDLTQSLQHVDRRPLDE